MNRQWSRLIVRHTKEFISHRQGYEQHVLNDEVVTPLSLGSVLLLCALTRASGRKEKQSYVEPSHPTDAHYYVHFQNPSLLSCRTNCRRRSSPQLHNHKTTAGLNMH